MLSAKHCAMYMSAKLFPKNNILFSEQMGGGKDTNRGGGGDCLYHKSKRIRLTEQEPQLQLVQSLALVHLQEEQSLEVSRVSLVVLLLRHVK